jgi:hypothetical protein
MHAHFARSPVKGKLIRLYRNVNYLKFRVAKSRRANYLWQTGNSAKFYCQALATRLESDKHHK